LAVDTIRTLSIDAVRKQVGAPGTPMALAPSSTRSGTRDALRSGGSIGPIVIGRPLQRHASMLPWSVLHLTDTGGQCRLRALGSLGVLEDIRHFRQLGSKAPGTPNTIGYRCRDHHGPARARRRTSVGMPSLRSGSPTRYNRPNSDLHLQRLRRVRRRLPDGGRRLGSSLPGRSPRSGQPLLDLRPTTTSRSKATSLAFTEDVATRSSRTGGTSCGW